MCSEKNVVIRQIEPLTISWAGRFFNQKRHSKFRLLYSEKSVVIRQKGLATSDGSTANSFLDQMGIFKIRLIFTEKSSATLLCSTHAFLLVKEHHHNT